MKLESRLRLGKAKLAAQSGDLKAAMEEFQAAAQAWPGNPALEDSSWSAPKFDPLPMRDLVQFRFDVELMVERCLVAAFATLQPSQGENLLDDGVKDPEN